MDRYPHKIIIQNSVGDSDNPYSDSTFETVFEGRCRCFLDKRSSGTDGEITENSYQVVIPSPNMVDIGENFKVGVKLQHNSGKKWDLVGFVKDFARIGDILLFHDFVVSPNTTITALEQLIPRLQKSGYEFVTVSELLGL